MTDDPIRDPAQSRANCARKLEPIETGGMFRALLAALLDEDWTTPKIEELLITVGPLHSRAANGRADTQALHRGLERFSILAHRVSLLTSAGHFYVFSIGR